MLVMCPMGVKWRVAKNVVCKERVKGVDYGTSSVLEKWLIGIGQCFGVVRTAPQNGKRRMREAYDACLQARR